jgi:hypothetical protein
MAGEVAVCAAHQSASVGTCSRCGSFVCPACKVPARTPILCRSCGELQRPLDERARRARLLARWSWLSFFFLFATSLILRGDRLQILKGLLAVALPVVGVVSGVGALVVRGGTNASGVLARAIIGVGLNSLFLGWIVLDLLSALSSGHRAGTR